MKVPVKFGFLRGAVLYFSMEDAFFGMQPSMRGEPKYVREARFLLETLFIYFKSNPESGQVDKRDIVRLIRAKHEAFKDGYMGFDQMLLDIVRELDETTRDTIESEGDFFDEFRVVVRCFERYDHVQSHVGMIAFTENMELTEPMLRSIVKVKLEFDRFEPGLFNELFIEGLISNEYVSYYGKKKLRALSEGLEDALDRSSINRVLEGVKEIAREERLYRRAFGVLKENLRRKFSSYLDIVVGSDDLRRYVTNLLKSNGIDKLPESLLEKMLLDLRKEFFYVNNILPVIKSGLGIELRDDFLKNSGLDKTYIEQLENEYLTESDREILRSGGGERI